MIIRLYEDFVDEKNEYAEMKTLEGAMYTREGRHLLITSHAYASVSALWSTSPAREGEA